VSLVEQKLLTLPEYLSSSPVFSGVRVTRSLVWCVCFVDRCLSFFSFGHSVVCPLIYRFWLRTPLVSSNSSYYSYLSPKYRGPWYNWNNKSVLYILICTSLLLYFLVVYYFTFIIVCVSFLLSTVKPAHVVTSIKQSPVLKRHLFLFLS
jgi:hypothetical protein